MGGSASETLTAQHEGDIALSYGRDLSWADVRRFLPSASRHKGVNDTTRLAILDDEFVTEKLLAERAVNAASWPHAEYHYWRSLNLYPLHPTARFMYAQCLKEAGKNIEAAVNFRSALALGYSASEVVPLIVLTARNAQAHLELKGLESVAAFWSAPEENNSKLHYPPTETDIRTIFSLFLGDAPDYSTMFDLMNRCPTVSDLIGVVVGSKPFAAKNMGLLRMIAETRWGKR